MSTTVIFSIDDDLSDLVFNQEEAAALITQFCDVMNEKNAEVSVSLIDDEKMKDFNHQYRGMDKPTDVLSFSMREGEPIGDQNTLGDIVISYDTAVRQAQEFKHSVQTELNELIFHGMMHLFGNDHEIDMNQWRATELSVIQSLKKIKSAYIPKGMCGIKSTNDSF